MYGDDYCRLMRPAPPFLPKLSSHSAIAGRRATRSDWVDAVIPVLLKVYPSPCLRMIVIVVVRVVEQCVSFSLLKILFAIRVPDAMHNALI